MAPAGTEPAPAAGRGRSLAVLAALTLLTEAAVRLGAPGLWARPALTEAVSRPLLEDRLGALAASGPAVALLGDSVLYGSALREHGVAAWRDRTPAAYLRTALAPRGLAVHSFAADGLEAMDQEALAAAAGRLAPKAWVVELNARLFAAEAGAWPGCLERPYLAAWLPAGSGAPEPAWDARAADGLRRAWATYRYMELASSLAWQPSLKDRLGALAARFFPPAPPDPDLRDALLDLKLRPYYAAPAHASTHQGWRSLARLAEALRRDGRPALVFLTPQNLERVDAFLDRAAFAENRRELARLFRGGAITYRDWAQRVPEGGAFLDHCHLDPAGNAALAGWIAEELDHAP